MARTACSHAWRSGSRAVPRAGSTSRVTATWPPRVATPPTMPSATTLLPVAGSMTVSRTLRTADSRDFRHVRFRPRICRRLIEGIAAVTYMQRDVKAKARRRQRPRGEGWRGTTTAAAPGAAAVAAAERRRRGAAAAIAAAAAVRSARAGRPTWKTSSARARSGCSNLMPGGFGSYKGIVLIVLAAVVIWLVTGFFRVQPNQQAIQLVFGKPYGKPVEPGLHYNLPGPIGNVVVVNVQDQRRTVIGSRGGQDRPHALQPRPAPDLDREPDADRRREHRRHRVRRAVADQGRVQVRLRRAQSARRTCAPAPRPPCAR